MHLKNSDLAQLLDPRLLEALKARYQEWDPGVDGTDDLPRMWMRFGQRDLIKTLERIAKDSL